MLHLVGYVTSLFDPTKDFGRLFAFIRCNRLTIHIDNPRRAIIRKILNVFNVKKKHFTLWNKICGSRMLVGEWCFGWRFNLRKNTMMSCKIFCLLFITGLFLASTYGMFFFKYLFCLSTYLFYQNMSYLTQQSLIRYTLSFLYFSNKQHTRKL